MKRLVDDIFSSIPGVTVIVSTLVKSRDHDACATKVSQMYRNLVAGYPGGTRIGLADINSVETYDMIAADGTHLTDAGYKLFAAVWWDAIRKLQGQIQPPAKVSGLDDTAKAALTTCTKKAGSAAGPIQIQKGSGHNDSMYEHSSVNRSVLVDARIQKGPDDRINESIFTHLFFAQLINPYNVERSDALDDWIRIVHEDDGTNTYYVRENLGNGAFGPSKTFDVDLNCDGGPYYAFADFNNDGLADFFCIGTHSGISVALNRGGNPPTFHNIGAVVPAHDGYTGEDVRIAGEFLSLAQRTLWLRIADEICDRH
jgi:hypothetical protein